MIPSTWEWPAATATATASPTTSTTRRSRAGHYLCRLNRDLSVQSQMNAAILNYDDFDGVPRRGSVVASGTTGEGTHEVPDRRRVPCPRTAATATPGRAQPDHARDTEHAGRRRARYPHCGRRRLDEPHPKPPAELARAGRPRPPRQWTIEDERREAHGDSRQRLRVRRSPCGPSPRRARACRRPAGCGSRSSVTRTPPHRRRERRHRRHRQRGHGRRAALVAGRRPANSPSAPPSSAGDPGRPSTTRPPSPRARPTPSPAPATPR